MPSILVSALVFGGSGFLIASLILFGLHHAGDDWHPLAVSSGLAAFGVSLVLWRFLCTPARLISPSRGAQVGALTGLLAHPVAWYLAILWMFMTGARSSLGDRPCGGPLRKFRLFTL